MSILSELIDEHYDKAYSLAVELIESRARSLMHEYPELEEFIMAMGRASFIYKGDDISPDELDVKCGVKYSRSKPFADLIYKYDEMFNITGEPMRFTAEGPKVTDW